MSRRPLIAAVLAALLLIPTAAGAEATAEFSKLAASRTATGDLRISGTIAYQGEQAVVSEDGGDVTVPGADIGELRITPSSQDIVFEMEITNPIPTLGAVPGAMHYLWELSADGEELQIQALNSDAQSLDPGSWTFAVQNCTPDPQTGQGTCSDAGIPVIGEYADGVISVAIPRASLGVSGGDMIRAGTGGAYVSYGAAGLVWGSGGALLADQATPKTFTMPDLTVELSTVDADGNVLETATPSISSSNRFANVPFSGTGVAAVQGTVTFGEAISTSTIQP